VFRKARYADPCLSPRPSLVLLDLRLPGIDGLEVLRTIKEAPELRSLPVVMLTTSAAEPDIAAAYRGHANSYLVKPAEFSHINEMTQALSSYWLEWNRNPEPRDNLSRKRTEGGML
jgi:CheY-like chemotaxis protein